MAVKCGSRVLLAKTCLECGEFKNAEHFYLTYTDGKRYWHSRCRKCLAVKTVENRQRVGRIKEQQEGSLEQAWHFGEEWTGQDLKTLEHMVREGFTNKEISEELGRTYYAVKTMRYQIKMSETHRVFKPSPGQWVIGFGSGS